MKNVGCASERGFICVGVARIDAHWRKTVSNGFRYSCRILWEALSILDT